MRFEAFAVLAQLLALRGASLGSSHNGSSMCPCIDDHWACAKEKLKSNRSCPDRFGIGCKTHSHNITKACLAHLYDSDAAGQLECGPPHSGESPWCETKWCYVNAQDCSVDWDWGMLGPYSYATCGNLRQGTAKYFQKALAAFLQNKTSLRVLHVENTLERGYLGNTACKDHYDSDAAYLPQQKCKGRIADFWARALDELHGFHVQVDHTIIRRGENGIDQYFIKTKLSDAFEEYKEKLPKNGSDRPPTNFDLCAFATGMGYADLCSGAFALTHRRQAMTFMIELYTSPVFMVSESKCDFIASDDETSMKFWFWWFNVFSPSAWGFFVGVVFFFIVAMKGLDECIDCLDARAKARRADEARRAGRPEGAGAAPAAGTATSSAAATGAVAGAAGAGPQSAMKKFLKYLCCFTHGLADALFGVFEAFAFQSKTSHRRDSNKPSRSRPSHMLRLGLGFFILLSMAVYGAKITAEMVSAAQVQGEYPSLEKAKDGPDSVSVCTHSVFEESLDLVKNEKIVPIYNDTWEEVLDNLVLNKCKAALLDDEAWNTFQNRSKLCNFSKGPTAEFYIPTGVVVSKRAYRTLETFRFAPSETAVFFDKSQVPGRACPPNSADRLCDNIIKDGVPWYMLVSLSLVAVACGLCSLCCIADHYIIEEDEENEKAKENERKKEEMQERIERLEHSIDAEMTMANIQDQIESLFGRIAQLLRQPHPRPPAEVAEPPTPDLAPESADPKSQNITGAAGSTTDPSGGTFLRPEFRRDPRQAKGSKEVPEHAQSSADSPHV